MKKVKTIFIFAIVIFSWKLNLMGQDYYNSAADGATENRLFNEVQDSIVIIEGSDKTGTGFIVSKDGAKWLVTNKHVIRLQGKMSIKTIAGVKITLSGEMKIANDSDLVMCKVDDTYSALELRPTPPRLSEKIYVVGNSGGSGVATFLSGSVLGIGADKFEVSAHFISGNSGSPVLDKNGEVLGVATYLEKDSDLYDWTTRGTRFSSARRYAIPINGLSWEALTLEQFFEDNVILLQCFSCASCFLKCSGCPFGYERKESLRGSLHFCNLELDDYTRKIIRQHQELKRCVLNIMDADIAYFEAIKKRNDDSVKMRQQQYGVMTGMTTATMDRDDTDIARKQNQRAKQRKAAFTTLLKLVKKSNVTSAYVAKDINRIKIAVERAIDELDIMIRIAGR